MNNIVIFVISIYILCFLITLLYTKNTFKNYKNYKNHIIIVLWSKNKSVFLSRIRQWKEIADTLWLDLYYTWIENTLNWNNFIKSWNTLEDATETYKKIGNKSIIIITSTNHIRRAYFTFRKVFNKEIICKPVCDTFSSVWAIYPLGWYYSYLNLKKNYTYNKKI